MPIGIPEQEFDERIHLRDRGVGRDIGRHPTFDGKRPSTRSENRAPLTSVGGAGERTEQITSWFGTPVSFELVKGVQKVVNGAGAFYGLSAYFAAIAENIAKWPTPDNWAGMPGTDGVANLTQSVSGQGKPVAVYTWTTAPTGGSKGIMFAPSTAFASRTAVTPGTQVFVSGYFAYSSTATLTLQIQWYDAGGLSLRTESTILDSTGNSAETAKYGSLGGIAPASANTYLVRVYVSGNPAIGHQLFVHSFALSNTAPVADPTITMLVSTRHAVIGSVVLRPGIPAKIDTSGLNVNDVIVECIYDIGNLGVSRSHAGIWVATTE